MIIYRLSNKSGPYPDEILDYFSTEELAKQAKLEYERDAMKYHNVSSMDKIKYWYDIDEIYVNTPSEDSE